MFSLPRILLPFPAFPSHIIFPSPFIPSPPIPADVRMMVAHSRPYLRDWICGTQNFFGFVNIESGRYTDYWLRLVVYPLWIVPAGNLGESGKQGERL